MPETETGQGLGEFELIERYFSHCGERPDVLLGVGDDCALLRPPPGGELAVTTDTLVEGVHFLSTVDPESLGHKALAVNLSDLAAMGAQPAWATLALTLPKVDPAWLQAFSRGFAALADRYGMQLVGGDTTRGPLSVTVHATGFVPAGAALRRSGAQPGDLLYVTGTLGDAGLALRLERGLYREVREPETLRRRLDWPAPRVEAGAALCGTASAGVDISDGLLADLGHLSVASHVGARVFLGSLPLGREMERYVAKTGDWSLVLAAGDDYELCLAVPAHAQGRVEDLGRGLACGLTRIGTLEPQPGLRCVAANGAELLRLPSGYQHFAADD